MTIHFKLNGVDVTTDTAAEARQLIQAFAVHAPQPTIPPEPKPVVNVRRRPQMLWIKAIADYINTRNKPTHINIVMTHFNASRHNVGQALSRTVDAGLIRRIGGGKYGPLPRGVAVASKSKPPNYNVPGTRAVLRVALDLYTSKGEATFKEVRKALGVSAASLRLSVWKAWKLGWLKEKKGKTLVPTEAALLAAAPKQLSLAKM